MTSNPVPIPPSDAVSSLTARLAKLAPYNAALFFFGFITLWIFINSVGAFVVLGCAIWGVVTSYLIGAYAEVREATRTPERHLECNQGGE